MTLRPAFALLLLSTLTACASAPVAADPPPPASATATPVSAHAAVPSASAVASVSSSPAEPSEPVRPKSVFNAGGVSLSDIDLAGLTAVVEAAGYSVIGKPEPQKCDYVELLQLDLGKKGRKVGTLSVERKADTRREMCSPMPIAHDARAWAKAAAQPKSTTATAYDEPADVLIAVDLPKETQAAAKELMARFNAK